LKSKLIVAGSKRPNVHHCLRSSLAEHYTFVVPKRDPPHRITGLRQLSDIGTSLEVEQLHATVVAAGDDESAVKLQAGNRVIVRTQAMNALERRQVEDDYSTVGPSGDDDIGLLTDLYLTD